MVRNAVTWSIVGLLLAFSVGVASAAGVGSRVFVVERASGSLAVYDYMERKLLPDRITDLGNLRHATMVFSPDLKYGYLSSRQGKVSRIDLETLKNAGAIFTSENSIDNAISHDGKYIATAEYHPGGVTILDAATLKLVKRIDAKVERDGHQIESRVTGMVDAPGNRFVCVLIEGAQIWIIDTTGGKFSVTHRIPTSTDMPYDAMVTPDGRYYVVGHMRSDHVTVLDLNHPEKGVKEISLRDPNKTYDESMPVKLPHMASWAVSGKWIFVPLVGEERVAVLERDTWKFVRSIPVKGHPVYTVASPNGQELWVSFSGEEVGQPRQ
ncbi:MAG: protein nirF [Deltaproteobacteria bacterium]|nr:protein nirF [Deltaproteobacteria bacterium]